MGLFHWTIQLGSFQKIKHNFGLQAILSMKLIISTMGIFYLLDQNWKNSLPLSCDIEKLLIQTFKEVSNWKQPQPVLQERISGFHGLKPRINSPRLIRLWIILRHFKQKSLAHYVPMCKQFFIWRYNDNLLGDWWKYFACTFSCFFQGNLQ